MGNTSSDAASRGLAWVDGRVVPVSEAKVSIDDRGFLFGEAVYEVFVSHGARIAAEREHRERLVQSATGIGLDPRAFLADVGRAMAELLAAFGPRSGLLYLQVTGGSAPRDHLPPAAGLRPTVVATVRSFDLDGIPTLQARGLTAIRHPEIRWPNARWKTTQLLAAVMGKRVAREAGADEVLFVDDEGYLLEGGSTNVFVAIEGKVRTPPLERNLLPGVMRRRLLERSSDLVVADDIHVEELAAADEVFIASTTRPGVAITAIDGHPVGTGKPGPLTRELGARLLAELRAELGV